MSGRIAPGASPQTVLDCMWLLFTKGTQWVCGGVEDIFRSGVWLARRRVRRTTSAKLLMVLQSLDQENPSYISAIREFASGGSISVGRIRNLVVLSAVWLRCQRDLCQGFLRAMVPTGGLLGKR